MYSSKSYTMTNAETHPSPGMRSHWPVIPAIRLLWTIMTPLGLPVEPLVYITTARSEGCGLTTALPTARQNKQLRSSTVCMSSFSTEYDKEAMRVREIHTILRQRAQLFYGLHAVDGEPCWVAFCAHFLLVHVDHMLQFRNLWEHILDRERTNPLSQSHDILLQIRISSHKFADIIFLMGRSLADLIIEIIHLNYWKTDKNVYRSQGI